ncbi:hypothetical protein [uncultured Rhodospira sp.]|uniref:hypothetical protein n=1 Tax=uncultured Rhodospira sp. TaxID=1936189 RepID=UPI00260619FE|nr:hypothetical protein [uncultured Rhodospira sp.]
MRESPDPRRAQGKRYPLPYLLLFTVLALLSGARSDRGIITRQEQRRVETFDVAGCLGGDWDRLIAAAARVTRLTWYKNTRSGLWDKTEETSLYVSQISLSAAAFGAAIRQHWGIENRNNYVRDVSFFEDHSRIRTKPGHFARLCSFALTISSSPTAPTPSAANSTSTP